LPNSFLSDSATRSLAQSHGPVQQGSLVCASSTLGLALQVTAAFILLEAVLWTGLSTANAVALILTTVCVFSFVLAGPFTRQQMGLGRPQFRASLWVLASGAILAASIALLSSLVGGDLPPTHAVPLRGAWIYAIWALVQQFLLQSFFFVRFEALLGARRAVLAAALLFAAAHIPNPILTVLSLGGGLFFCEMFRRYRNIYALGLAHAMLGLTVAASFSDPLLHRMRVGIGYLLFHA